MSYDHSNIENKWQKAWDEAQVFKAEFPSSKPKFYALDMFPYPSGSGLHVGHLASYLPTDVIARFKKAQGFNVLHPMGYDAFGLPAEQYAIQTGVHPKETTEKAIQNFKRQLSSFGFSFDWSKSVATTDPQFLKWTQYIFTQLFKDGLAYQKEVPVNWCPELKTVLANEEVVDGKSERGGHPVTRIPMKQWMLKITDYAESLLKGLENLDWPQRTKEGQKNWIGKSTGANVTFKVKDFHKDISVYTTRPDTLFGVNFIVLAPENPLVLEICSDQQRSVTKDYIQEAASKSEVQRQSDTEKTGCFIGAYALHPLSGKEVPIWISDYVLMGYGTGAIMAVPAHDERDFEFATKFEIPITRVLEGGDLPFTGEGKLINSEFLNGLNKTDAIKEITKYLEEKSLGKKEVQYKLRDWLFSRQRYWGEPIPVLHKNGESTALELDELPLTLPEVANYEPSDSGESPLANNEDWINTPQGSRESHTMPGSAGSSWYFLRYPDADNDQEFCSKEKLNYWLPVDLYVGGPEHTVGHLLYSRFWTQFLHNKNLIPFNEPFKKLAHQGMILGPDGEKMSKSRGNVINPDEVRKKFGSDAVRIYISFMGPFDKDKPWNTNGIEGSRRFLDRVYRLCLDENKTSILTTEESSYKKTLKTLHKTIKKVTEDIEAMSFNTAISSMMILVNDLYKSKSHDQKTLHTLLQLLSPFAPHITQEIWSLTKEKDQPELLCNLNWPKYDDSLCAEDTLQMGVQVNGKMRGTIDLTQETTEEEALDLSNSINAVQAQLESKKIVKVIYKPGKILNIIAK